MRDDGRRLCHARSAHHGRPDRRPSVYEAKTAAFGGNPGIDIAHDLLCAESHAIINMLRNDEYARPRGTVPTAVRRFEAAVLDYHFGGRDISEVLAMSVAEAGQFFGTGEARTPAAHAILDRLADVGSATCA